MPKPDPVELINQNLNPNNPNYNTYSTATTYNYYNNPTYDQLPYLRFVSIIGEYYITFYTNKFCFFFLQTFRIRNKYENNP